MECTDNEDPYPPVPDKRYGAFDKDNPEKGYYVITYVCKERATTCERRVCRIRRTRRRMAIAR